MAKKATEACDYAYEVKRLKNSGPEKLYLLYGPEDHLSSSFLSELRTVCLPDGDDGFSLKRFEGPELNLSEFEKALDTLPFLSDRIFVELKNIDLNKISDADEFVRILKNIPDYCTAAFWEDTTFEPDGRLKSVKYFKSDGKFLLFDSPADPILISWIKKRFAAGGKKIGNEECERLLFLSGKKMCQLIPEIDKIVGYAKNEQVTLKEIEAVASHIPEADIFRLFTFVANRENDNALRLLSELLSNKKNEPIAILALLSFQLRRLFAVRLILDEGGDSRGVADFLKTNWQKVISETVAQAKRYSAKRLADLIEKCADTDYLMKSSSVDDEDLLKDFVLALIL